MREPVLFLCSLLLAGVAPTAVAHPGADAHLQATDADHCDPHTRARRLGALIDEARLFDARTELEANRDCLQTVPEITVAEANLLQLEGHPELAIPLLDPVLKAEPSHAGARSSRAHALTRVGRPDQAADDWLAMARAYEGAVEPWFLAAQASPERAPAILDEALEHTGPLPAVVLAAARAHAATNPARALALLADQPDTVDIWLLRAHLHHAQGALDARANDLARADAAARAMRPSPRRTELLATIATARTPQEGP